MATTKQTKPTVADKLGTKLPDPKPIFYEWARQTPWTYGDDAVAGLTTLAEAVKALEKAGKVTARERLEYVWALKWHIRREAGDPDFMTASSRKSLEARASKQGVTVDEVLASFAPANQNGTPKPAAAKPVTPAPKPSAKEKAAARRAVKSTLAIGSEASS